MKKPPTCKELARKIQSFTTDVWRVRTVDLPPIEAFIVRYLRIGILAVQGFQRHHCTHRASALTFYALLSIVPVLAMAFGLAKGFGLEAALETQLLERFEGQQEVIGRAVEFARSLLETTKGGVIAGIGVLLLFWTIIRMLGNIESAFNQIWDIQRSRSIGRMITDYLSAMVVCPVLFLFSSAATVLIAGQIRLVVEKITLLGAVGPVIFFFLRWLPYAVMWVLFTFVYLFMPNKKIRFIPGLFAGIVSGTLYQLFQWGYLAFQIGVAQYNAIYGSFAALPLFLVWLQASWMIVLFGAELSFAHQNEQTFEFEPDRTTLSYRFKRLASLQTVHLLVKGFSRGEKPPTAAQIGRTLGMPIRLVQEILDRLVRTGLVSSICRENAHDPMYQPALALDKFTVQFVIDHMENHGTDNIPSNKTPEMEKLSQCLISFQDAIQKSPGNLLLKDI
jgi:membrane protein